MRSQRFSNWLCLSGALGLFEACIAVMALGLLKIRIPLIPLGFLVTLSAATALLVINSKRFIAVRAVHSSSGVERCAGRWWHGRVRHPVAVLWLLKVIGTVRPSLMRHNVRPKCKEFHPSL